MKPVIEENKPGIYKDIPDTEYHAQKWAVSSSFLKKMFTDSPYVAHYWDTHPSEDTPAFAFGRAFHTVMTGVGQKPVAKIDGRTKEGKEQKALAEAGGVLVVTDKEMAALKAMERNLLSHPVTERVLAGALPELSMFWQDPTGVWCRIRPDLMNTDQHVIVDLKTINSSPGATPGGFSRETGSRAYDIQAAFYRRGYRELFNVTPTFLFVVVEKSEPYQIGVYQLSDDVMDTAEALVEQLLTDYSLYSTFNSWPGISTETQVIALPGWATNERENYLS